MRLKFLSTRRRSQSIAGYWLDFQSFRSMLTPLTYFPVGDEVIEDFKCIDASHELLEMPYSQISMDLKAEQLLLLGVQSFSYGL